jgi:alanyl aminopeptidase
MVLENRSWSLFLTYVVFSGVLLQGVTDSAFAEMRLDGKVIPKFESIELKLDPGQSQYRGSVRIELDVKEETDRFRLHSEGLILERIEIIQDGKSLPFEYDTAAGSLIEIRTHETLSLGSMLLTVDFSNDFDTTAKSLYRMENDGLWYVFSQFESNEAREAFPCWDEPIFKLPYQVTLIVPEGDLALTNTPAKNERISNGWKTVVFEETKPLPSYLLAIVTGPLETVPIPGMSIPGRVVTIKGRTDLAGEAVKSTPPILAALEKYFGQPYPFEKLDLIAVPEFWYGAMENPGAVTYSERILLLDPLAVNVHQRRSLAIVTAHELAHMWFGDLVTMKWWDDLWLNESFASWIGDKIAHEVFPEFRLDVNQVRKAHRAMIADARPSTRAVRQPVEATDNLLQSADVLTYNKGQAVLNMFEQWLGADTFRKCVIEYLERNAWGNASAGDFWSVISGVSGDDIAGAMSTFLDQGGVPLVTFVVDHDKRLKLSQERFSNYGVDVQEDNLWTIPVVFSYSDGSGTRTRKVFLSETEQTIPLNDVDNIDWVLPNVGMNGYYRWSISPQMMEMLVKRSTEILTERERVGLIGNLSSLLDAGEIRGDSYLKILNAFADDPVPQVISTLLTAMEKVKTAFVTEDLESLFAVYVRHTLGPALRRYGLVGKGGEEEEIARFRPQLISWMADEGKDGRIIAFVDSLTREHLNDPTIIDPSLADVVLDLSAHHGDRTLFEECRDHLETTDIPRERSRYIYMMGCFRDSTLVEEALRYTLEGPLRPMEAFMIPRAIRDETDNDDRLFQWVMDNYEIIASRIPAEFVYYLPLYSGGCSRERLAKAQVFFTDPQRNLPGVDRQLAMVSDQVNDCASLREREGKVVAEYLEDFRSR